MIVSDSGLPEEQKVRIPAIEVGVTLGEAQLGDLHRSSRPS